MSYQDEFNQENSVDASVPVNSADESSNTEEREKVDYETVNINKETVQAENFSEDDSTRNRSPKKPDGKLRKNVKGFASLIAAGVIGSALTLSVLPHTDYLQNFNSASDTQSVTSQNSVSQAKPVTAQPTSASAGSIADTVQKLSKAIVGIVNYQDQQQTDFFGNSTTSQNVEEGSGSGVIFQKQNGLAYIVTNNHVVEGASKLEVSLYDGTKVSATVVGTDALTDLAVLKIDGKHVTTVASFGDSSTLRPGDQVYAIGNPLGLDLSRTVTSGIVSATNRSISVSTSAGDNETTVIQTDAAINPGNSGGALITPQGLVVGINSMKISETGVEGLGFAIPSNDVIPIVNQLIKSGKIARPYLGVGLADLDQAPQAYYQDLPSNVKNGVIVVNIDPNSAAARAGFQPKDVIVKMNGTSIGSSSDLRKYLYTKAKIGDKIKVDVYRNGKLETLSVTLTSTTSD